MNKEFYKTVIYLLSFKTFLFTHFKYKCWCLSAKLLTHLILNLWCFLKHILTL